MSGKTVSPVAGPWLLQRSQSLLAAWRGGRAHDRRYAAASLAPTLLWVFGFAVYPIGYALYLSVHELVGGPEQAAYVGLRNYAEALHAPIFWTSVANTLLFTIPAVVLVVIISFGIAMILRRPHWLSTVLATSLLLPYAVPGTVSAVIWRWIYDPTYGVLNAVLWRLGVIERYIAWTGLPHLAMPCLIFAYVWKFVPYSAFLLLAGLMTIPQSVYEAAAIDGAGRGVIFRRIILPMMWPVIQLVLVFQTIFAMTMHFGLVYVLTGGGPGDRTTTLAWYTYVETFSFLYFGRGAALAMLQALLMAGFIYLYLVVLAPERRAAEAKAA